MNQPQLNTIEYHLMRLPTEIRYRALHNRACLPLYPHYVESTKDAITCGFNWEKTPEGFDFWFNLLIDKDNHY